MLTDITNRPNHLYDQQNLVAEAFRAWRIAEERLKLAHDAMQRLDKILFKMEPHERLRYTQQIEGHRTWLANLGKDGLTGDSEG